MKLASQIRPNYRKPLIITVAACALLAAVMYVVFYLGAQQWQAIEASALESRETTRKRYERVIKASNETERTRALTALSNPANENCDGQWWYSWQRVISSEARSAKETCDTSQSTTLTVSRSAVELNGYLKDEHSIGEILQTLSIGQKEADRESKLRQAAVAAEADLATLEIGNTAEPVREIARKAVRRINTSWKQLEAASKAESEDQYTRALDALSDAYASLEEVADKSETQLEPLLGDFTKLNL